MNKSDGNWSLAGVWNQSLDNVPQRELEPRNYCWASELGGSYYDRYFKMQGRQPTTPPNARTKRKFEAGNLIEWVILQVLNRAGVLKSSQEHFELEGIIDVTGRCDFEAGGEIQEADFSDLPETIAGISEATIAQLKEKYPDGLANVNVEIKSCAGLMFERYLIAPSPSHALQSFVQAKATDRPTLLVYVSRDDLRICEWKIMPKSEKYQKLLDTDLEKMAEIIKLHETEVPKEPLLTFDDKFSKNWKVEYSNYLTDYGFERPDLYADPASSVARRLNNIVKKLKEGKELTKINQATLEECYAFYSGSEDIISNLILAKGLSEIDIDKRVNVQEYKSINKTTYPDLIADQSKKSGILTEKILNEQFNNLKEA
jgi:hypothetical protein